MSSLAGIEQVRKALSAVDAAVEAALDVAVDTANDEVIELLQGLESSARRLAALQVAVMAKVDQQGLYLRMGTAAQR